MTNPLLELQSLGQSIWYDNIRRGLLVSGELKALIDAGEICGVTSNPTIFEKAIAGSDDYDAAMLALAEEGLDAGAIFDRLAIEDIQAALDLFRPLYEQSRGGDGYVSIEVNPLLADDTASTLAEARRLWQAVDRPNLMIKIPATPEGIPAVQRAIAGGVNVNVTLIFSLARYAEVIEAYLSGLEQRVVAGEAIGGLASVASFFVSRVDTLVDSQLEATIRAEDSRATRAASLRGTAAVANAKLAYAQFRATFSGQRWARLEGAGARLQRPLWASTSTKDPAYPDVKYVEDLIGPDTVNTMPPATIDAYRDHGRPQPRLERDLAGAQAELAALAEAGIRMDDVTLKLEQDGVASFSKSFETLMQVIERKRASLRT